MAFKLRKLRPHGAAVVPAVTTLALIAGCGAGLAPSGVQSLFLVECDGETHQTANLFRLDWYGGTTPIYPDQPFKPLDLARFPLDDGGALADHTDAFKERVRAQIAHIFCQSDGPRVRVEHAAETNASGASTVYFTQAESPAGGFEIGEGEYDPCDRYRDNAAVIFGEQIRWLGGRYTLDEWVNVFANVSAHEIGHALGYGHIPRHEYAGNEHPLYVELMLSGHTMAELRREHRILIEQDDCPQTTARAAHIVDVCQYTPLAPAP